MPSALVLSDLGDETWGAVLEDGVVAELHVENTRRPGIGGNIYKGRVTRVLPGMQSAFVDIGLEKDAFLHVSDLPAARTGVFEFEAEEEEDPASGGGSTDRAGAGARPRAPTVPIGDLLREGQELLVQVAKEAIAGKGARLTAQIALPGRVLVYLPSMDRVLVSRRIEETGERERLARLADRHRKGGGGWIVRTAAEGATEAVLERDAVWLIDLWASIKERDRRSGAPILVHPDLGLAERLLRDVVSEGFQDVIVDSERLERLAAGFLAGYMPRLGIRVKRVDAGWALFEDLGIHEEIQRARGPRVWLKSGGSIVVNQTEALVAIDVNTGKYVGRTGLEETALRTNLEAVREIVRLLRLRDLGGIIVIDFIDMTSAANRERLSQALSEELRKDRSRTKLLAMSDFGLVQLTRKRTRRSLDRTLQIPCPACQGGGRIRSAIAIYYEIQRDLTRAAPLAGAEGPAVHLNPATIARLEDEGLRLSVGGPDSAGAGGAEPRLVANPSIPEDRYEVRW